MGKLPIGSGLAQSAPLPPAQAKLEPFLPPWQKVEPELLGSPGLLAPLEPETHDPDALLARVRALRAAGVPLYVLQIRLDRDSFERGLPLLSTSRITPITIGGKTQGIRFSDTSPTSFASLLGLLTGDVVLSVNGYGMDTPETALIGYEAVTAKKRAVFEVLRRGKRIVLDVAWL